MMILAEGLPSPTAEELFSWLKVVALLAGLYYLGLKIVKEHRRNPTIDKELGELASRKDLQSLQVNIMPRAEVEGEVQRLDGYVHDMRHEFRQELQSITIKIDESNETVRVAMTTMRSELEQRRSQGIGGLHQQLKATEVQVSAVAKEAEIHTAQIAQLDQKIDRMPERIKALLHNS